MKEGFLPGAARAGRLGISPSLREDALWDKSVRNFPEALPAQREYFRVYSMPVTVYP